MSCTLFNNQQKNAWGRGAAQEVNPSAGSGKHLTDLQHCIAASHLSSAPFPIYNKQHTGKPHLRLTEVCLMAFMSYMKHTGDMSTQECHCYFSPSSTHLAETATVLTHHSLLRHRWSSSTKEVAPISASLCYAYYCLPLRNCPKHIFTCQTCTLWS